MVIFNAICLILFVIFTWIGWIASAQQDNQDGKDFLFIPVAAGTIIMSIWLIGYAIHMIATA